MMKNMITTPKVIVAAFAASVALLAAVTINEAYGEVTEVGEPYTVSWTACTIHIKGVCHKKEHGTEVRVNTEIKGLWWDMTGYKVKR